MSFLSVPSKDFPILKKWEPKHPDHIQLYALGTPNGFKPLIFLEEAGLPYELHRVDFAKNEQKSPEFLSLNPNGKIPAMIDPQGPEGLPFGLFESGAMLIYLADKTGEYLDREGVGRWRTIQWLMFQMGGIGPMFGQVGFFHKFAGKEWSDKRPLTRYVDESKRLLGVMDDVLSKNDWITGKHYSIADMSLLPWVHHLLAFYEARDLVEFERFTHVQTWLSRGMERPALRRAMNVF